MPEERSGVRILGCLVGVKSKKLKVKSYPNLNQKLKIKNQK
jgi:hypothetical protein